MSILSKLQAIQAELKAPKSQFNKFGGYNYRNCEDILEALKPLCAKHGAAVTLSDEVVMVGDRYYIKATARLEDTDDSSSVEATAYAREGDDKKGMDVSQLSGSTSSYARKYALNGLFAIDDTKDADYDGEQKKPDKPKPVKDASPLPEPTAPVPTCARCGGVITDSIKKNGAPWPASQIADYTRAKFGAALCVDCATMEKEASNEQPT